MMSWDELLTQRRENVRESYKARPQRLGADHNEERQKTGDYAGRELLELLQNAADAARENGGGGCALLRLTPEGLLAANTGAVFTPRGVESLMLANLSAKPGGMSGLIGAKGLGFRAMLNWSRSPFLLSGDLALAFSPEIAASEVDRLSAESATVDEAVRDFAARHNGVRPAPVLTFPAFGPAFVAAVSGQRLIGEARTLRGEFYDTVIALPFTDESTATRARTEMGRLDHRFLLFVEALDEVILDDGETVRRFRAERGSTVELIVDDTEQRRERWIVATREGVLPPRATRRPEDPDRYHAAVGMRVDQAHTAGFLHAFFPTTVPLPLPALFHASLALTDNRDQLQRSEDNDIVLAALATLHVEAAERQAQSAAAAKRWIGVYMLTAQPAGTVFPQALAAFEMALLAAAAEAELAPRSDGTLALPRDVRLTPVDIKFDWLPARLFSEVAAVADHHQRNTLARLGASEIAADMFKLRLSEATLSVEERVRLIRGAEVAPSFAWPGLLLDGEGRPFADDDTAFPPRSGDAPSPRMPAWAEARFIDEALWNGLEAALGPTARARGGPLKRYGVEEYSFEALLRPLAGQAEKEVKRKPGEEDLIRRQLLTALAGLRVVSGRPVQPASEAVIKAKDQTGIWRPIRQLHLGAGYGAQGEVVQALYATRPDVLLAPAAEQLEGDAPVDAAEVFAWLGANRWPAPQPLGHEPTFSEAIRSELPDEIYVIYGDRPERVKVDEVSRSIEGEEVFGFDSILSAADPFAIAAWVLGDPRFDPKQPSITRLKTKSGGQQAWRTYDGPLPDYLPWRLRTAAWLPVRGPASAARLSRERPDRCLANPAGLDALFSRPLRPSSAPYGLDAQCWALALTRAGVPLGVDALGEARIYALLDSLEQRAAGPDAVRALLTQVLAVEGFDPAAGGKAGERFKQHGRLWGVLGGVGGWRSVSELVYVPFDAPLTALAARRALLDLPPRRNGANVWQRFGVRSLSEGELGREVTNVMPLSGETTAILTAAFDDSRAFVAALRRHEAPQADGLQRLARLRLLPAQRVHYALTLDGERYADELDPWTHLLNGDDLHVCIPNIASSRSDLIQQAADAVGAGLAELFRVSAGDAFARLFASAPPARRLQLSRTTGWDAVELNPVQFGNHSPAPVIRGTASQSPSLARGGQDPGFQTGRGLDRQLALAGAPQPPEDLTDWAAVARASATPPKTAFLGGPATSTEGPAPAQPNPDAVTVEPVPHTPASPSAAVRLDVRRTPTLGGGGATGGDPFKSQDAEYWAKLFEQQQGRWARPVPHIVGYESPGCDLLSFATEADEAAFDANPRNDLVARFIEVKSGMVKLTTNQVAAAGRYRERYFVYQLFFKDGGRDRCRLYVLIDPLSRAAALQEDVLLQLERDNATMCFDLTRSGGPSDGLGAEDVDERT